jgi:hypothetical protein
MLGTDCRLVMVVRKRRSNATRMVRAARRRRPASVELRNRRRVRTLLRRLAQLLALLWLAACSDQAVERPRPALGDFLRFEAPPVLPLATIVAGPPQPSDTSEDPADADPSTTELPYVCERFELRVQANGRYWHKRLRRSWTDADRQRFRKLVEMVANELGADPKLLTLWALRESTYNPYAIHVLDPDLEASTTSWRRHRWNPERAAELEAVMAELGARDRGYWIAKAELARISKFRDNHHFDAKIDYEMIGPDGSKAPGQRSAWGYGYGPFGFNPTYFVPTWDPSAPPWMFCNDDGIAAIVTAIWAAREHQRECAGLGFGDSYEVVNGRFSSGHCSPRPARAQKFRTRAVARGIDPEARAKLGDRWPADRSDRAQLLEHLRTRAAEQGLLSEHALVDL